MQAASERRVAHIIQMFCGCNDVRVARRPAPAAKRKRPLRKYRYEDKNLENPNRISHKTNALLLGEHIFLERINGKYTLMAGGNANFILPLYRNGKTPVKYYQNVHASP